MVATDLVADLRYLDVTDLMLTSVIWLLLTLLLTSVI